MTLLDNKNAFNMTPGLKINAATRKAGIKLRRIIITSCLSEKAVGQTERREKNKLLEKYHKELW